MSVLLWGLGIPTFVLVLQIFIWRIRRPVSDNRVLVFMIATVLLGFISISFLPLRKDSMLYPDSTGAFFYALTLALAVSMLYFITYATLEAKSPSTIIVMAAQEAKEGLTTENVASLFSDDEFICGRVARLESIRQVHRQYGRLFLTLRGRLFLELFIFPRRLMRVGYWGG
jgi:hypothetical protein